MLRLLTSRLRQKLFKIGRFDIATRIVFHAFVENSLSEKHQLLKCSIFLPWMVQTLLVIRFGTVVDLKR